MQPFLRMIYLDQRGSGASTNASNYHLDRVVKDFDEVIEALGFERVCLIAHSFGGILASEFAARYPGRVSAIIMLNAAVHFHSPYNARMRIEFADRLTGAKTKLPEAATPEQLEAAQVHALEQLAKKGLGYRLLSENPTVQRRMQEADNGYERTLDFGTRVLKERVTYADYYRDHAGTTARVTTPVLVLTGDRDHAVGPAQYRFFRFPNQVVRHIDGGHLMYFEQTDQVVEEIRRFLAGNGFIPDDDHGR